MNDPIVNEVRQIRNNHSKKFNYKISAIVEDYRSKHQSYINLLADIRNKSVNKEHAADS